MRGQYTHYEDLSEVQKALCQRIEAVGCGPCHQSRGWITVPLYPVHYVRIIFRHESDFFEWGEECPVSWRGHDRHYDQVQLAYIGLQIYRDREDGLVESYDEARSGFQDDAAPPFPDSSRMQRLLAILRDFKASYWYKGNTYVFLHGMGFGSFPGALDARLRDLGGRHYKHCWTGYAVNYLFDQGAHHPFALTFPVETSLRPNLMFTDKYDDPVHLEFTTPRQVEEFARASRLTAELFNTLLRAVEDVREHDSFSSPLPLDAPVPPLVT